MDNDHETEVIKFATNETRVPLKEKLRALEQQIVDIVQVATNSVEKRPPVLSYRRRTKQLICEEIQVEPEANARSQDRWA